uniref:NADH dehydrogenase subunit 6 n=1 Tax=Dindymus rubiginosus TaxID=1906767 RepID=A0A4Y1JW05_9HEMI|nr:NADH dehydrogenase subunit 6 [Dindymus rubiginosus]APO08946.1 NADH dehydrogenase subunit 6 [Dindymus rubiginosus]
MYLSLMIMNMISCMLIMIKHPISMGLIIIIQTMNISMMMGLFSGMFWFSYIIIIMMLSGMLVLFIYMASMASNEKFYTSVKVTNFFMLILLSGLIIQNFSELTFMEFNKIQSINNTEILSMVDMMNNKSIIILMVTYLFFSMIVISTIVSMPEGPLRMNK